MWRRRHIRGRGERLSWGERPSTAGRCGLTHLLTHTSTQTIGVGDFTLLLTSFQGIKWEETLALSAQLNGWKMHCQETVTLSGHKRVCITQLQSQHLDAFCIKFCNVYITALSEDRRPVPSVSGAVSRFSVDYLLALLERLQHFVPLMLEPRGLTWEGVCFEREPRTQMVARWFAPVLGLFPDPSPLNMDVCPRSQWDAGCLASALDQRCSAGGTKGPSSYYIVP